MNIDTKQKAKIKLFRIKGKPSEIQKDAYIDIFANDDDLFYSSVSNVVMYKMCW